MTLPWPTEFVSGGVAPAPGTAPRRAATVVMFFNLECPGCVSRGVPFLKRIAAEHGGRVETLLVHTALGHRQLERDQVVPTLRHFAETFAKVNMPVALDLAGDLAGAWGVEGTPHWFVFGPGGELRRSLFGSQDNARTRIEYLLEELAGGTGAPP